MSDTIRRTWFPTVHRLDKTAGKMSDGCMEKKAECVDENNFWQTLPLAPCKRWQEVLATCSTSSMTSFVVASSSGLLLRTVGLLHAQQPVLLLLYMHGSYSRDPAQRRTSRKKPQPSCRERREERGERRERAYSRERDGCCFNFYHC